MSPLLEEFQEIWRKFGSTFPLLFKDNLGLKYDEATHAFMVYTFLTRATNGHGARLEMQYAEGRGRVDICAIYKGIEYPIEIKVKNKDRPFDQDKGLTQLAGYMESSGAKEGWIMVFEQNRMKPWEERKSWVTKSYQGYTIHIIGY
jgi:Holliday junction resolvase